MLDFLLILAFLLLIAISFLMFMLYFHSVSVEIREELLFITFILRSYKDRLFEHSSSYQIPMGYLMRIMIQYMRDNFMVDLRELLAFREFTVKYNL
jgi:hypothetical protein